MTGQRRGDGTLARAAAIRFRDLRRERHLTLLDIEEMSGGEFSQEAVNSYETGARIVSIDRLWGLCRVLGVSPWLVLPPAPGVAAAFAAITAAKDAEIDRLTVRYETELDDLREQLDALTPAVAS